MYGDNKLPLLDVKMWITTLESKGTLLMHEYYQKKVASRPVVHARSSLPWSTKRTVIDPRCAPHTAEMFTRSSMVETFMQRVQ